MKAEAAAALVAEHAVRERDELRRCVVVGIGGPVSVGKSTFAELVRVAVGQHSLAVAVLCTDCFLLSNAELARRDLSMRKGFPGTYDDDALVTAINAIKAGGLANVPVYSHSTYDTIAGELREIGSVDVLVVEGINALQSPVVASVDLTVYLEAAAADLRNWFVDRFAALCESATPEDFYGQFTAMSVDQRHTIADAAWSGINVINNRDHIAPSRANARLLIQKDGAHLVHSIGEVG